jgi:hypothetical protein
MGKEVLTPSSFLTLELDCREDRIQVTGLQGGQDTGNRTAGGQDTGNRTAGRQDTGNIPGEMIGYR